MPYEEKKDVSLNGIKSKLAVIIKNNQEPNLRKNNTKIKELYLLMAGLRYMNWASEYGIRIQIFVWKY
jgi:hypothetical protein